MDLEGKHVVIIGGSSGWGWPPRPGRRRRERGHDRVERPGRLDAALAALPGGCSGVVVDVRSEASVAGALAGIGELDHLVYTAGDSVVPRPLAQVPPEEARRLLDVRFWGAVAAVRHAAPGSGRAARSC